MRVTNHSSSGMSGEPELYWRQPDMMVTVDEPRQHYLLAAADRRDIGMLAAEFRVGADLNDRAVFLQNGTVRHLVPAVAVNRMRHHSATADQRCGHVKPPQFAAASGRPAPQHPGLAVNCGQ